MAITKAVIPAGGLGTRFLPATKAVPKELLPVVDIPAIEYAVAEAADAGLTDVLVITGKTKGSVLDHFDVAHELEQALTDKGDEERLAAVRRSATLARIHAARQSQPRGLGDAVLCARDHVGDEFFAVLLADDLIDEKNKHLRAMLRVHEATGGSVLTLMRVPAEQIGRYGSAGVAPAKPGLAADAGLPEGSVVEVTGLVEKPQVDQRLSDLAVIGRYVLSPTVFPELACLEPGRGGEIQLTDAIARLAARPIGDGGGVWAVVFEGKRYDVGDRLDYLKAVVEIAAGRADLGPDFRAWLAEFVAGLPG